MSALDANENHAASVMAHAEGLAKLGQHTAALTALHNYVTQRSRSMWNKFDNEIIHRHVNLCIKLHTHQHIRAGLQGYRQRVLQMTPQLMIDAVTHAHKKAEEYVHETVKAAAENKLSALEKTVMHEMTGIDASKRVEQHSVDQAVSFFHDVTKVCMTTIGYYGKYEALFQSLVQRAFQLCLALGRKSEFGSFCEMLRKHATLSFDNADQRTAILNSNEALSAIIVTKCMQLKVGAKINMWNFVFHPIFTMRQFLSTLVRFEKPVQVAEMIPYYETLTDVLFTSKNPEFHAHIALRVASLQLRSGADAKMQANLASKAVLAVLCVPENTATHLLTVNHDANREKLLSLAKAFALDAPPSRGSLTIDVMRPQPSGSTWLNTAYPVVKQIFAALNEVSSVSVCRVVAPLLQQLKAEHPELACYIPILQDVAVRSMFAVVSTCFSKVRIDHFMELCAFFPKNEFATHVEPLILAAARDPTSLYSLSIDMATESIRFTPGVTVGDRVIGIQGQFAQRLSSAVPLGLTAAKATNPFKDVGAMQKRIEEERDRTMTRSYLCGLRHDKHEERVALEKKRIEQRKKEDLARRHLIEEARIAKRRKADEAKLTKQVADQEAVERRKWVMKALMHKHKGFEVPASMAAMSAEAFTEAITDKLLAFRRKTELTKASDARMMNHWERACRDQEVPVRVARDEELVVSNAAEFEARRLNLREQHHVDYETQLATKRRLERFEEEKYSYESELSESLQKNVKGKMSKRDAENDALEQVKLEREQMAAEAAAEKEAKAGGSAPAPAAAPATLGGGGAKWAPKSRQ